MNHQNVAHTLRQVGRWRKSSRSKAADDCVEIAEAVPGWVGVRDSKLGDASPIIALTAADYRGLLAAVRAGASGAGPVQLRNAVEWRSHATGGVLTVWHVRHRETGVELHFTEGERVAFVAGVWDGEMCINSTAAAVVTSILPSAQPVLAAS